MLRHSTPTESPTTLPTEQPTQQPSEQPSQQPTQQPSEQPTQQPTQQPSEQPSQQPTDEPTQQPSQQPTDAPTESCSAVVLSVADIGGATDGVAVTDFNGIYSKQASLINGMDWWSIRDDQPTPGSDHSASIYWSDSTWRWVIESPEITWEAPKHVFNALDDDSHFPGLQEFFGDSTNMNGHIWEQLSVTTELSGPVSVTFACFDTTFPTQQPTDLPSEQPSQQPTQQPSQQPTTLPSSYPTQQPTQQPSEQPTITPTDEPSEQPTFAPTLAPTETCSALQVTVSAPGVTDYNGIYNKQDNQINGYNWWVARNDVSGIDADTGASLYFSTSHNRWVIEAPGVYFEAPLFTSAGSSCVPSTPADIVLSTESLNPVPCQPYLREYFKYFIHNII